MKKLPGLFFISHWVSRLYEKKNGQPANSHGLTYRPKGLTQETKGGIELCNLFLVLSLFFFFG